MKDYHKETGNKIQIIVYILVFFAIIFAFAGRSDLIAYISNWAVSAIIGIVLTGVSQLLLQAVTGDILEKILLNIEIKGYNFSLTLFAIFTVLLKFLLFK